MYEASEKLLEVLNGNFFVPMTHYCSGVECCENGFSTTVERIVDGLFKSVLRAKPVVPQLSRWSKPVASLDFWAPCLAMHAFIARLL